MIDYIGLFCLILTLTGAINAEIFSFYNEKDSNPINTHSTKKLKSFPHDSFEFTFPFFNDLFPLSGLDTKPKEVLSKNNLKEEKDIFLDLDNVEDIPTFDDKGKKKNGKDKLIMSFTELFIPFQNHKNQYDNNVKRNTIFDDVFGSFPFIDFDEGLFDKHEKLPIKKHRIPKKKYDKNIKSINSTTLGKLLEKNYKEVIPKRSKVRSSFEPKFLKPQLFSKYNNTDQTCCDKHKQCHKGAVCTSTVCKSVPMSNENSSLKKSLLVDKTFLICVIPGLIGFGALIFGIEVLRRHNELVKKTPFLSQYNHIETC